MTSSTPTQNATEEQIVLLQQLADSLAKSQQALLHSDVNGVDEHTRRQSEMCEQLRSLRASSVRRGTMSGADGLSPRWADLEAGLAEAERRVRHLNTIYGALLRRAQRSVQIMQNLVGNALGTYHPLDTRQSVSSQMRS